MKRLSLVLVAVIVGASVGCSNDAASTGPDDRVDPPAAESTTTTRPEPTIPWEEVSAPSGCMCSDGSPFRFLVREKDPAKVVFFMQGGGACFDKTGCGPSSDNYTRDIGSELADYAPPEEGVFELDNPDNPFADYSMVFVPYCTGDVHIGNTTTDYGDGVVVNHVGFRNASAALAETVTRFPAVTDLVVAGVSGGSVPSPLYAGLFADRLADTTITVIADGSGGYPDIPGINAVIGSTWGTLNAVPAWPETAGMTAETWSFPGLFITAGKHAPRIRFARQDFAFDRTQVFFAGLAGIDAAHLDELIDRNETQIEAAGVGLASFIAPGSKHTVLESDRFYTHTVEGVRFVDWVDQLVTTGQVDDVHCVDCGAPEPTTTAAPTTTSATSDPEASTTTVR